VDEREAMRRRAIELRLQGLSTSQIARELGIRVSSTLNRCLVGTPAPEWTRRPTAKDAERKRACQLRAEGLSLRQISEKLDVAKSSVSIWVADVPTPPICGPGSAEIAQRGRDYWKAEMRKRDIAREQTKRSAAEDVGSLSDRDLLLVGAILYWAEGSKDKPYDRRERVVLINSDERLIRIFLRWLELLGVPKERLRFRLSIHESACIEEAQKYWGEVVGVSPDQFDRATIKRNKASTVRLNVGADYHGCVIVTVLKSALLYRRIEGWVRGIDVGAEGFGRPGMPAQSDSL
jgi:transcriptional regulator with XRE-family HTH domain